MRHHLLALVLGLSFVALATPVAAAPKPAHLWSLGMPSTSTAIPYGVAVDAFGSVVVAGGFLDRVNCGGGDLVSAGGYDIFVAKFNSAGVHVWSQRFGSTGSDLCASVAVDGTGNVLITGYFGGTVNFGGTDLISAGGPDIFLARYNPLGLHLWSKSFGSTSSDAAASVTTDLSSNVIITGSFNGTVAFGGVALTSAGSSDAFFAKYNSSGTHQWSKSFGSTSIDDGNSVATDNTGAVYLTGGFGLTVNFGGSNLTSAGATDIFLAKFNSAGTHTWSLGIGSTSSDVSNAVAVDPVNDVLVTGYFNGTVNFGGGGLPSAGGTDIFLAKFKSSGSHTWSQRFGSTGQDASNSVMADASGNVFITGSFNGSVNFGGGVVASAGLSEIFLASYSPLGAHRWSGRFGATAADAGRAVDIDGAGGLVTAGEFGQMVDFGGGAIDAGYSSFGYLARFNATTPAEPSITSIEDIGNDQGRRVRITFAGSGGDDARATIPVASYHAFRRIDPAPAMTSGDVSTRALLGPGWTEVASVSAFGESEYSIEAPTIGDSTVALGGYESVFYIRAATVEPARFFDSPADGGYSLDNLAPGAPQNFVYESGGLEWDESSAVDFDFFTVYGSNADAFGSATVVDYSIANAMDVSASPYVYYYVTATDFSGNEGKPAKINTLSGVGGTPKNYVLSVSNYPNPFNPRTTVSYTVPSRGRVTVAIYDARGAHVATLFDGERNAGAYTIDWDGRADDAAVAASGVYFARIEHASGTRSKKMVLIK